LQFAGGFAKVRAMSPLALVFYEKLLPGSQIMNRLQDLGWRVQTVAEAGVLTEQAARETPMVVLVDLLDQRSDVCAAITRLKKNPGTEHVPVIAFGESEPAQQAARLAGATLVVNEAAILSHLPQLLDQALTQF
jgi:CheY-like chemotaxis protein